VQQEAAERLCAPMGNRACGAITAAVEYYAEARMLFKVSRGSFLPVPNVDSAVLQLVPREKLLFEVDEAAFFRLIRAAFGQRRKTAANAISAGLGLDKPKVIEAMQHAQIPPTARAEGMTLEDYARLLGELPNR